MGKVTISAIKADVGGYVGPGDVHPDMLAATHIMLREAIDDGLVIDGRIHYCGDEAAFDRARQIALEVADYIRRMGPFEPARLPHDEMEYTAMPAIAERLAGRWRPLERLEPAPV